jgi:hypothetical protein
LLVPPFADHCFIDLFQGDALICRVRRHAGGWTPPGTWKQAGEQIVYPEGHFCQLAMARLDTVIVNWDRGGGLPSAQCPVHGGSRGGGAEIGPALPCTPAGCCSA